MNSPSPDLSKQPIYALQIVRQYQLGIPSDNEIEKRYQNYSNSNGKNDFGLIQKIENKVQNFLLIRSKNDISLADKIGEILNEISGLLAKGELKINDFKIIYKDTRGYWEAILQENGNFIKFLPIRTTDLDTALAQYDEVLISTET